MAPGGRLYGLSRKHFFYAVLFLEDVVQFLERFKQVLDAFAEVHALEQFFFIVVEGFQPFEGFGAFHHEGGLFEEVVELSVFALEERAQGTVFVVQKD